MFAAGAIRLRCGRRCGRDILAACGQLKSDSMRKRRSETTVLVARQVPPPPAARIAACMEKQATTNTAESATGKTSAYGNRRKRARERPGISVGLACLFPPYAIDHRHRLQRQTDRLNMPRGANTSRRRPSPSDPAARPKTILGTSPCRCRSSVLRFSQVTISTAVGVECCEPALKFIALRRSEENIRVGQAVPKLLDKTQSLIGGQCGQFGQPAASSGLTPVRRPRESGDRGCCMPLYSGPPAFAEGDGFER